MSDRMPEWFQAKIKDKAYIAGLLDGEGSIAILKSKFKGEAE